jgi:hypothetical protein
MVASREAIERALGTARLRSGMIGRIPDLNPLPNVFSEPPSELSSYDQNPEHREKYLAQKRMRGISDALMGTGDLANMGVNAAISDVDYWTSGGLSGGTYDPYQLPMASQSVADLASMAYQGAGYDLIDPATMPPHIRGEGEYEQQKMGLIPTGLDDLAGLGAKGSLAVIHGMPNLFKKPALEDLAKGVDPDKVWHDWQWEMNAAGQPQTETIGAPKMNESAVHMPSANEYLPPRGSDFEPSNLDQNQPSLFSEREMADPGGPPRRNIPMAYDPTEPLSPYDPRVTPKHRWRPGTVSDFIDNPTLYEQPGLEFLGGLPMNMRSGPLPENAGAAGLYHHPTPSQPANPKGRIQVTKKGNPNPVSTTQHELTHAAAQEFGLPQGYSWLSPDAGPKGAQIRAIMEGDNRAYEDVVNQRRADYWRHEDEMFDKYGDLKSTDFDESGKTIYRPGEMSLTDFNKRWGEQNPMMQKILDEGRNLSDLTGGTSDEMLAYHTSMGEVAARNSALRDTGMWTPQRLRDLRPAKTEDVPRKYQWTAPREGGDIVKPAPPAASAADDLVPAVKAAQKGARQTYRANWRDLPPDPKREDRYVTGEYDPEYFDIEEDLLRSDDVEGGRPVGVKDKLVSKPNLVDRLPAQPKEGRLYRGMSADEYEAIQKSGMIQSGGEYNIGDSQKGLTYFTTEPDAAESYASSFAPKQFKPTFEKPAYVVGVKDPGPERFRHVEGTAGHERGIEGAISADDIEEVYRGSVAATRNISPILHWEVIDFIKKYGIAGALGAGLITQQMADQLQAQQGGGQS